MLGELVPCGGGMPISLLERRLVVGRRFDCDITIQSRDVSSRHCVLEFDDARIGMSAIWRAATA